MGWCEDRERVCGIRMGLERGYGVWLFGRGNGL